MDLEDDNRSLIVEGQIVEEGGNEMGSALSEITTMLRNAGNAELADVFEKEGAASLEQFSRRTDRLAGAALLMAIRELSVVASQKVPQFETFPDAHGREVADPVSMAASAKLMDTKIRAASEITKLVVNRLPSQAQYDPHVYIGGMRYPIPYERSEWLVFSGELAHRRTHAMMQMEMERVRRQADAEIAKVRSESAGGGQCVASKDGKCAMLSDAPALSSAPPPLDEQTEGDDDHGAPDDPIYDPPEPPADW